jgi:hypothetical protein
MKKVFTNISVIVLVLYLFPMGWFICYYNWKYAKEHSFGEWFLGGEIVPIGKGIAWPYFCFFYKGNSPRKEDPSYSYFADAVSIASRTNLQMDKMIDHPYPEKIPALVDSLQRAIDVGKKVNIDTLNNSYSGLGDHFKNEFIQGLYLVVTGYHQHNLRTVNRGDSLSRQWSIWLGENASKLPH